MLLAYKRKGAMQHTQSKQPKCLYLLNFVSMWECFSYYGMRVLLVLFMVHELKYSDEKSFGMYALYTTLIELGAVFGGIIADRLLGLKRSIVLGGITIALGHISMTLPHSQMFLFLGLGLIISGTSLFRSNVTALLGDFYTDNDPRRDAGFTLYYTGINLGGFLATLTCGIVGEVYGWHAGFSLAALGMFSGLIALYFGRKILKSHGDMKKGSSVLGITGLLMAAPLAGLMIYYYQVITPLLPAFIVAVIFYIYRQLKNSTAEEMRGYRLLGLYVVFLMLFYGCEEQLGSSLVLFSERHVDRSSYFGVIPAASLITCNPLTILIIGPLFSKIIAKIPVSGMTKISMSFLLLALSFGLLYWGAHSASSSTTVGMSYAVSSIVLLSFGELLIGPTVYAVASSVAPKRFTGLVMGIVALGYSGANLFSGVLSQMMSVTENAASIEVYTKGFGIVATGALVLSLLLFIINSRKKVYAT